MSEALAAALVALVLALAQYVRELRDQRLRQAGERRTRADDRRNGQRADSGDGHLAD